MTTKHSKPGLRRRLFGWRLLLALLATFLTWRAARTTNGGMLFVAFGAFAAGAWAAYIWQFVRLAFSAWRGPPFTETQCAACGYELTGTLAADGCECPECGEAISPARRLAYAAKHGTRPF